LTARTLARAGAIVVIAYLGSRILGWLRIVVIGNQFGAGADLDAYFAAFRIPDLIYQLVAAGAVSSALIPVLTGLLHTGESVRAERVVSTVVNALLLALVSLSALMAIFADVLVPPTVPGFAPETVELTIGLTRLMLLSPIFLALGAVATAVLNTQGRFGSAAVAPLLYNLAIIGSALLLGPWLGVHALAFGVVLGAILHLAVQLPVVRRHLHYQPRLDLTDAAARQTFLLMGPRALGLGATQITFIVNTALATGLGVGAVVAYNVAFNILQIPIGVIGFPLGVVLLPALSRAMAADDARGFGSLVVQALRLVLFLMLFLSAVGFVLRGQIVSLLFDYGSFDARSLALTADTLAFFLLGTAAHSMNVILARAFYSRQDTRTPVIIALLSVTINVVVSLLTVGWLGLSGLALGIATGGWIEASLLAVLLWRRAPAVDMRALLWALGAFGVGALLAGGAALATVLAWGLFVTPAAGKLALLLQVFSATLVAGLVYLVYSRIVRAPEPSRTLALMRSALRRG